MKIFGFYITVRDWEDVSKTRYLNMMHWMKEHRKLFKELAKYKRTRDKDTGQFTSANKILQDQMTEKLKAEVNAPIDYEKLRGKL